MKPKEKYVLQISTSGRYEWAAVVADCTFNPPKATTIMAKSIHELMAKVLIAVSLREMNLGVDPDTVPVPVPEDAPTTVETTAPDTSTQAGIQAVLEKHAGASSQLFTPPNRIIRPSNGTT